MIAQHQIDIAREFSPYPIGRDENDSDVNGKKFRIEILVPALRSVRESDQTLVVILEGLESISSSFLEEAFGGLVRFEGFTRAWLRDHLDFRYNWRGYSVPESQIWQYINQARPEAGGQPPAEGA